MCVINFNNCVYEKSIYVNKTIFVDYVEVVVIVKSLNGT